jgi:outer membrane protein OmpA-like peptidoglycan-associated protein
MNRTFLLLLSAIFNTATAQNAPASDTSLSQLAMVNVVVTDMKGKPSKGEQILFKNETTQKLFSGQSNAAGKFSLQLPVGSTYLIKVKSLTDTSKYGRVDIPALGPGEYYTEPFKVDVKFKLAKSYTLDNVHFDFGKASLRSESFPELEEVVGFLKNKEDIRIEIAGHTDNVGTDADNLKLSQQRADAIRSYLLKKGIPPARVTAKGYGASQPVADNTTDSGRQLNRRTEVRIL